MQAPATLTADWTNGESGLASLCGARLMWGSGTTGSERDIVVARLREGARKENREAHRGSGGHGRDGEGAQGTASTALAAYPGRWQGHCGKSGGDGGPAKEQAASAVKPPWMSVPHESSSCTIILQRVLAAIRWDETPQHGRSGRG